MSSCSSCSADVSSSVLPLELKVMDSLVWVCLCTVGGGHITFWERGGKGLEGWLRVYESACVCVHDRSLNCSHLPTPWAILSLNLFAWNTNLCLRVLTVTTVIQEHKYVLTELRRRVFLDLSSIVFTPLCLRCTVYLSSGNIIHVKVLKTNVHWDVCV